MSVLSALQSSYSSPCSLGGSQRAGTLRQAKQETCSWRWEEDGSQGGRWVMGDLETPLDEQAKDQAMPKGNTFQKTEQIGQGEGSGARLIGAGLWKPPGGQRWLHLIVWETGRYLSFTGAHRGLKRLWSTTTGLLTGEKRRVKVKSWRRGECLSMWSSAEQDSECTELEFQSERAFVQSGDWGQWNEAIRPQYVRGRASIRIIHLFTHLQTSVLVGARFLIHPPVPFPSPGLLPRSKSGKHVWHRTQTGWAHRFPR